MLAYFVISVGILIGFLGVQLFKEEKMIIPVNLHSPSIYNGNLFLTFSLAFVAIPHFPVSGCTLAVVATFGVFTGLWTSAVLLTLINVCVREKENLPQIPVIYFIFTGYLFIFNWAESVRTVPKQV